MVLSLFGTSGKEDLTILNPVHEVRRVTPRFNAQQGDD